MNETFYVRNRKLTLDTILHIEKQIVCQRKKLEKPVRIIRPCILIILDGFFAEKLVEEVKEQ